MRTQAELAELLGASDRGNENEADAWELGTTALAGARELGMHGVAVRVESLLEAHP